MYEYNSLNQIFKNNNYEQPNKQFNGDDNTNYKDNIEFILLHIIKRH